MGAGTSRDARRHIREWGDFFREFGEIGAGAVDELLKRYEKRKYFRQSLRRLINAGFIIEQKKKFSLTNRGKKFFLEHYPPKNVRADGRWYLLSFDIPVKLNRKRARLREFLRKYNFFPFQKSVWVGPYSLSVEVWKFVVDNDLQKYCKPMVVEILEGIDELKKHFKLK